MRKNFLGEAQLLAKFGSHANVMGLLKVVCQSSPQLIIVPYMPHGSLKNYLKKCVSLGVGGGVERVLQMHVVLDTKKRLYERHC